MPELTITRNGVDVPVHVNTTTGDFTAQVGDDHLSAKTWAEIGKLIDKATKKVSKTVDVPFTSVSFNRRVDKWVRTVRHGRVTGMHSGNSNLLVKWDDDGSRSQLERWNSGGNDKFRPLTSDEIDEYARLYVASEKAADALRAWERDHRQDLRKLTQEALAEGTKPKE